MIDPIIPLRRKPDRTRLYQPVTFHIGGDIEEARLRDISNLGALLEASVAPPVGSTVHVDFGQTAVEGRVAWVDSTWFGIEFTQPVSDGVLGDRKAQKLKVSAPRWYRREVLDGQKDCISSNQ
ncbi:MAG TPA: PilZ domain-containing protein [Xanthobacteraceae bacterium]|nr:PilZ domain-containing protein [Xanthobacteraceae bacterium]